MKKLDIFGDRNHRIWSWKSENEIRNKVISGNEFVQVDGWNSHLKIQRMQKIEQMRKADDIKILVLKNLKYKCE